MRSKTVKSPLDRCEAGTYLKFSQHFQSLVEFLPRLRLREPRIPGSVHQDWAAVSLEHEPLGGDFYGGDLVGGGFGFDFGDCEEVFYRLGEAAVAVDPVFLEGFDGFLGVCFGEFSVGVDAEFGVGEVGGGDEGGEDFGRILNR